MKSTAALLSLLALPAAAWNAAPTAMTRGRVVKAANTDRRDVLRGAVAAVVLAGLQTTAGAAVAAEPSAADLKYKVRTGARRNARPPAAPAAVPGAARRSPCAAR